jgi:hypothetical protein
MTHIFSFLKSILDLLQSNSKFERKKKRDVDGKILFLKGKLDLILLHISSISFSNPRLDPYSPHYNVLDGGTVPKLGGIEDLQIFKNLSNFKIYH